MFKNARIKLTVWYALIILVISFLFSTVIYRMLTLEVERFSNAQRMRIERGFGGTIIRSLATPIDLDLIEETKMRILWTLIYVNGGVLVIAGSLSYLLAGKTLQPIKEMVDEQKRFISDASHELRTPLTALKSSIEVHLRDKKLSLYEAKKLLQNNVEDVDRLKELSDGLLALSTFEKGNGKIFEDVDLKKVIDEAIKTLAGKARERKISIIRRYGKSYVRGNRQSLTELVNTLLDNAIKYSDQKKIVIITVKKLRGRIQMSIVDHGRGIKKQDLPHVFERFYRADESRSEDGYGLGLAIAKKTVEAHRGRLWVKSVHGKGSTFFVNLPG